MDTLNLITIFLFNIVLYSCPLLYGTLGEIMVEKSGSLNLGVEGTMAVGAIVGYIAGCVTNSLLVGVVVAFVAGGLMGLLFAWLTVSLQANQNVTGLTLTTFGLGLYFFIGKGFGENWLHMIDYPALTQGFSKIEIPLLSKIPVIGPAFFSQNILVYFVVILAVGIFIYMKYTKAGLRMRAVGESPSAADAIGINIKAQKYMNIIVGSGIMGIGGLYMGLNLGGSFEGSNCWINGYGWIAVALVIFANWNPLRAIIGTFVFGFFNTMNIYGGSLAAAFPKTLGWLGDVPSQFYKALPFIITAVVLVVASIRKSKNSGQPGCVGINYFREDR